jgi:hypothetical protein
MLEGPAFLEENLTQASDDINSKVFDYFKYLVTESGKEHHHNVATANLVPSKSEFSAQHLEHYELVSPVNRAVVKHLMHSLLEQVDDQNLGFVYKVITKLKDECEHIKTNHPDQNDSKKNSHVFSQEVDKVHQELRETLFNFLNISTNQKNINHHTKLPENDFHRHLIDYETGGSNLMQVTNSGLDPIETRKEEFIYNIHSIIDSKQDEHLREVEVQDDNTWKNIDEKVQKWYTKSVPERLETCVDLINKSNKNAYNLLMIFKGMPLDSEMDNFNIRNRIIVNRIKNELVDLFIQRIEMAVTGNVNTFFSCWEEAPDEFKNSTIAYKILEAIKKISEKSRNNRPDFSEYLFAVHQNLTSSQFDNHEKEMSIRLKKGLVVRLAEISSNLEHLKIIYKLLKQHEKNKFEEMINNRPVSSVTTEFLNLLT